MAPSLKPFSSWDEVLAHVSSKSVAGFYYHAPLDYGPTYVIAKRRGNGRKIRILAPSAECDSFWADESHLSRCFHI
jgi:hypothetical protein